MNDIDNLKYLNQIVKYMNILSEYGVIFNDPDDKGIDRLIDDLIQIFEALPIIVEAGADVFDVNGYMSDKEKTYALNLMKYLANTINYIKCMKPIVATYNPSEEDKKKFLEFIGYNEDKDE